MRKIYRFAFVILIVAVIFISQLSVLASTGSYFPPFEHINANGNMQKPETEVIDGNIVYTEFIDVNGKMTGLTHGKVDFSDLDASNVNDLVGEAFYFTCVTCSAWNFNIRFVDKPSSYTIMDMDSIKYVLYNVSITGITNGADLVRRIVDLVDDVNTKPPYYPDKSSVELYNHANTRMTIGENPAVLVLHSNMANYDATGNNGLLRRGLHAYANNLAVRFFGNGGNPVSQTVSVASGSSIPSNQVTTPIRPPTATQGTFIGWFDTADPTGGTQFFLGSTIVTDSMELYARWTPPIDPVSVLVTFDANGGLPTVQEVYATKGATINNYGVVTPSLEVRGYTFDGWYDAGGNRFVFNSTIVDSDITLYARYKEIDYRVPGFYVDHPSADVYALISAGNTPDAYIDLMTELIEIPSDFEPKSYSVKGGTSGSWTYRSPVPKDNKMNKLLNKELELVMADGFFEMNRDPPKRFIKFPKISERPKLDKISVNYESLHISSGALSFDVNTPNQWIISGINPDNDLMMKTASDIDWSFFSLGSNAVKRTTNKVIKDKYTVAIAPQGDNDTFTYAPQSKTRKITVSGELKPPNYKIDYKNEIIKLKKGDIYSVNSGGTSFGPITDSKLTLNISQAISDETSVQVRKAPTAKKPASAAQTIQLAPRASITSIELSCSSGKITSNMSAYEVFQNGKWKKFSKGITSGELPIRVKATAKVSKGTTRGFAASLAGTLKLTQGTTANGKSGIVAAEIIGPV